MQAFNKRLIHIVMAVKTENQEKEIWQFFKVLQHIPTEINFVAAEFLRNTTARRCERSEAIQHKPKTYKMLLDCFASLATTGFSILLFLYCPAGLYSLTGRRP